MAQVEFQDGVTDGRLSDQWIKSILHGLTDREAYIYWINREGLKELFDAWGVAYDNELSKYKQIIKCLKESDGITAYEYAVYMHEMQRSDHLNGILFRIHEIITAAEQNKQDKEDDEDKIKLSQIHFEDLNEIVLEMIKEAKMVIWISMYTFTKIDILEALAEKTREGVTVEIVLSDNKENKKPSVVDYWEKMSTVYWYPEGGMEEWYSKDHQKFAVIDGKKVVHGSNNFTESADRQRNHMSIDENQDIVDKFIEEWKSLRRELKKEVATKQIQQQGPKTGLKIIPGRKRYYR
jgi:MarR-like DNA-binding transcriptional regulator SgrR of sgrS sRNA